MFEFSLNELWIWCVTLTFIFNCGSLYLNLRSIEKLRTEKQALAHEVSSMWNAIQDLREQQKPPIEAEEVEVNGEVCYVPKIK